MADRRRDPMGAVQAQRLHQQRCKRDREYEAQTTHEQRGDQPGVVGRRAVAGADHAHTSASSLVMRRRTYESRFRERATAWILCAEARIPRHDRFAGLWYAIARRYRRTPWHP